MYVHSLYEFCYRSYIQWECHSVLAKLHPITFYRIFFWGVCGSWLNATFCFLWFTNCVLLFEKGLILGCLWPLVFVFKEHFDTRHLVKELIPSLRSWLWHHRLPNVTTIKAQPRLWWHLGVCGVTAMTENEVSISILSWYHKINFDLRVFVKPNCLSAAHV